MSQPSLFDGPPDEPQPVDHAAREFAVDPANLVVLEASAGTGKTRVLVDRYVRLIQAGVDPRHILAITFTRKAAAEMRDRVLAELNRRAGRGELGPDLWRGFRDRIADIQIATIDAFCFGLLREFPLEADVDPAFEIADETEMARFRNEALELTLRAARGLVTTDETVRLLFARVKQPVLREAIDALLDRRHVALPAVAGFVRRHAGCPNAASAGDAFVGRLRDLIRHSPHRSAMLDDGPVGSAEFVRLQSDLASLDRWPAGDSSGVPHLRRRLERYFLTRDGKPRQRVVKPFTAGQFASADARRRHEAGLKVLAPAVLDALSALDADVNGLLSRGVLTVLAIAVDKYEGLLEEHTLIDFAGMLSKSVALLERQEEFARSRLKLQSRYHHVLVDEFQDTSRPQWRLVELLVDAWGEGEGTADAPTSIFVVGDRKQSIYRFRHAEAALLDEAARKIAALRPGRLVRQAITHSFRAVPELLAFINALAGEMRSDADLPDRFSYGDTDRFPVPAVAPGALRDGEPVLGAIAQPSMELSAAAAAVEIQRLLESATVRDRAGGAPRRAEPGDVAILFRARAGHQYFEEALESRGIRTYVYKGLGFFDAPEVQDVQALIRYLAEPESDLRAAELLRSRLIRVSDVALARLAPSFARVLRAPGVTIDPDLDDVDRALLARARSSVAGWLALADRVTPSELIDLILREGAYPFEMRGRRMDQARENLKKVRGLVRRVESRGYATLGRLADYFQTLRAGEESHAIVGATGCVNLMTIHAAKGLEFPIVFLVNLHVPGRGRPAGFSVIERGTGGEPEVAFGTTEGTRLEEQREMEEMRRLLYVAVTRARDRLYLVGQVDRKGLLKRPQRSLAALLPAGLANAVAAAAAPSGRPLVWESRNGSFALRTCEPPAAGPPATTPAAAPRAAEPAVDRAPLRVRQPVSVAATAAGVPRPALGRRARRSDAGVGDRLIGTLVHRLFQRRVDPALGEQAVAAVVPQLTRMEEWVDVADAAALSAQAAAMFLRLRGRDDVARQLARGACHYEVPFSFEVPDRPGELIRGVVDCLVVEPDGAVTVLEFKTGARRPEHEAQAALYAEALQAALPGRRVQVKIVYP
jgi:ATP-dependent helicase/nuclease subunit A